MRRRLFAQNEPVVISDVRFENEADYLVSIGAIMVRIERIEAGAVNGVPGHVSEGGLGDWPGWDYCLDNNGSREDLYAQIDIVLDREKI